MTFKPRGPYQQAPARAPLPSVLLTAPSLPERILEAVRRLGPAVLELGAEANVLVVGSRRARAERRDHVFETLRNHGLGHDARAVLERRLRPGEVFVLTGEEEPGDGYAVFLDVRRLPSGDSP